MCIGTVVEQFGSVKPWGGEDVGLPFIRQAGYEQIKFLFLRGLFEKFFPGFDTYIYITALRKKMCFTTSLDKKFDVKTHDSII